MSNLVFTPCTGGVVIKRTGCDENTFLVATIDNTDFAKDYFLSGISLELSGNYQFLHTVNDFVYFYAFGDRVGTLTVTGIGFLNTCPGSAGTPPILGIYDFYLEKRTAVRGGKALEIVLSSQGKQIALWGFLTGVKFDISDSEFGAIGYWTLRLEVLPKKNGQ